MNLPIYVQPGPCLNDQEQTVLSVALPPGCKGKVEVCRKRPLVLLNFRSLVTGVSS
jgi:hypothetical protein